MSTQDASATIEVYNSLYVDNRCLIGVMALLAYEFLITFDQEVEMFWVRKMTGASVLFLSNRYLLLLGYILVMCEYIPMSDTMVKAQSVIHFLQYLPWAAFSGLRAFALNGQSWPLPTLIFLLSLMPMGVNFAQYSFGLTGSHDPTFGCLVEVNLTVPQAKTHAVRYSPNTSAVTILSRVPLIVADILVIAVTWFTMRRRVLRDEPGFRSPLTLSTILLRDGTIYFIILLILNVLHLTLTMISLVIPFDPSSQVTTVTEPVTAVLVSRFLIDLQTASRKTLRLDSQDSMYIDSTAFGVGTLSFARVVGSLGSSLESASLSSPSRDEAGEDDGDGPSSTEIDSQEVQITSLTLNTRQKRGQTGIN
ncbi:hypothetical protein VTO73DRAFT_7922 [Trametes versicolor]